MKRVDIRVVTAVWGQWHLDAFLDAGLPTLLGAANLPALAERHAVVYRIHTRAADADRIRNASTFQRLAALLPTELSIIGDERFLADPIVAHARLWQDTIEEARRTRQFVMLMPPDLIWSDGSLAHVADLLGDGKRALFAPFPRVASNSFLPAFHGRFGRHPDHVAMSGRELVGLCLDHLHPLMAAHARASSYFPAHAEIVLWPVAGEGIAARVFCREPLAFDAASIRLNRLQLLDDPIHGDELNVVTDSDRLFAVSLAPLGKDVAWHVEPWRVSTLDIAQWSLRFDSPTNDYVASARIRWHRGRTTERLWRAPEIAGDLLARRAALEREALRVIARLARDHASRTVEIGRLLALSVLNGRLARALRGVPRRPNRSVVAFVPLDGWLAEEGSDQWADATAGIEHLVRAHVAVAPESVDFDRIERAQNLDLRFLSGEWRRLSRSDAGWWIDDVAVSRVERVSAGLVLCYTRGLLRDHRTSADVGAHG